MSKTPQNPIPETMAQPDPATIIDQWFVDSFHNSPVARDTDIYNQVAAAVADLKQRLATAG